MNQQNWAIIGGGIMGMTIAHRLAQKGHKVTIFEASADIGGLASSWKLDGFTWDKFYHVILLSDLNTRKILEELSLSDKIKWVETKTGFYTNGKLYSMSNILEFLKFPPLNLIDKFRLGLTIFAASRIKNWKKLEKIPVSTWLKRWSGENTFNKIWLPLLRAKLGDAYKDTSAAFIWATIQRMYAARKSGLKKEMFGYVEGGYSQVLNAFKNKLLNEGVELKTNYSAKSIKLVNNKPSVIFSNNEIRTFDQVIVTLPSNIAAKLCSEINTSEALKLNNVNYIGVICASVVLNRPISQFYVTNITDSWVPFTGVIEMSALVDKSTFNNNSLIYLPKYLSPQDPLFNESDQKLQDIFKEGLKKMYPDITDENIKHIAIAKARNVFALSTVNYSENLPDVKTTLKGIYILNSSQITNGTLNVNETIQVAENKLNEILNEYEQN
jgi:protoporphyrinogen oxidase